METNTEDTPVKIENCEVCAANPFKYTCPRCEVKTCCLKCVTIHKQELSCNGQRDCTTFVPMSKFDNLKLLSDYRFLEDIDRAVTNSQRNPLKHNTRHQRSLPPKLWSLKTAASKRQIDLLFLPQHFSRHKANQSVFVRSAQEIHWKLDFIFPQGEMIKISETVSEKTKLATVLEKYLDPARCPDVYKQYLRFYHAAGLSDVEILLKAERCKNHQSVYLLDLSLDVNENLCKKTIIENPIIYVIRKAYKDEFVILDEDAEKEELTSGTKAGFFGDFTPFHFFDSAEKAKNIAKEENNLAYNTIMDCAQQLKNNDFQ